MSITGTNLFRMRLVSIQQKTANYINKQYKESQHFPFKKKALYQTYVYTENQHMTINNSDIQISKMCGASIITSTQFI